MIKYAIITAGGSGIRMGSEIPKQFLDLCGKPILMYSIERFFSYDKNIKIIVSLPEEHIDYWLNLCSEYKFKIEHKYVIGGKTRFHSIKNALEKVIEPGLVAVHDGVRPLVSTQTIKNTFLIAEKSGNAIASRDIVFSLRKVEAGHSESVDRSQYKEIQTPQTFQSSLIKEAYEQKYIGTFTDDASVIEKKGNKINLVEGNCENIKITDKADMIIAEVLLNSVF